MQGDKIGQEMQRERGQGDILTVFAPVNEKILPLEPLNQHRWTEELYNLCQKSQKGSV